MSVCVPLESFNLEPAATAELAASGRRRWLRVKQPALQITGMHAISF